MCFSPCFTLFSYTYRVMLFVHRTHAHPAYYLPICRVVRCRPAGITQWSQFISRTTHRLPCVPTPNCYHSATLSIRALSLYSSSRTLLKCPFVQIAACQVHPIAASELRASLTTVQSQQRSQSIPQSNCYPPFLLLHCICCTLSD